jgi:hypothetical protein
MAVYVVGQTELALAFGDLSSSLHSIENGSEAKSLFEYTLMSILDCNCSGIEMRLMRRAGHLRPNVQLSPELVPYSLPEKPALPAF